MVSLGNTAPGNRSGAYFFEDNDSDDNSVSDISPLIHHPTTHSSPSQHTHLITGYLSAVEVIVLILFAGSLVGLTAGHHEIGSAHGLYAEATTASSCPNNPDRIVAYFCMIHVLVWAIVGVFDRVIQWRHQALRRKGYLKFYRKMRNIRRLPFIFVSLINAVILLFISLLYIFSVREEQEIFKKRLHSVDFLYIIVGLELILTLPCLIYYIVRATQFNCAQQAPDVIQDTYSGSTSPTNSVTAVGFRDGEDLDELLERQADMIRYLQQHNANLGRRILELQSQALE